MAGEEQKSGGGADGFFKDSLAKFARTMTVLSYAAGVPYVVLNHWEPTALNARRFWQMVASMWTPCTVAAHMYVWKFSTWSLPWRLLGSTVWFWSWDWPNFWFMACSMMAERVFTRTESKNRLFNEPKDGPKFHGKRIIILGNGPSLATGTPMGAGIDAMNEVVRFNNFQTKVSGLEAWTGTKTTVHFSDSMLYPSWPEYKAPGATLCLSLFMDRLVVSGSYFLFRMGADLAIKEAAGLMFDPELGWISHEEIVNLKKVLQISKWKHPTSGCLAIDWFVRHRPDPSVPVCIHGFDFFQGPTIHYYDKTEPLYERLNDLVGVTLMHEPHKEKAFVERLIKEGKVKWLKDAVEDGDLGAEVKAAVAAAAATSSEAKKTS